MEQQAIGIPSSLPGLGRLRRQDLVTGAVAAAVFALLWLVVPSEWSPAHTGGKWFLAVFVATSGMAAGLASGFLSRHGMRNQDHPAAWLGIQVLFWNPLAYRAVLALTTWVGLPSDYAGVAALVGLVLLGLPTSLLGAALCRSPSWIAVYLFRALTCLFVTWVPLLPALVFLHLLLFAHLVTWEKYGRLHQFAVGLVVAEQLAAFTWVFVFGSFS